jgi:hypothetical protein
MLRPDGESIDMVEVLSEGGAAQTASLLGVIAERLSTVSSVAHGCTWCGGTAGVATFFAEYARVADAPATSLRRAEKYMSESLEGLGRLRLEAGLFDGVAGVAWATAFVGTDADASDDADEDAASSAQYAVLDRALLDLFSLSPYAGPFDIAGGMAGIALYALERGHDPLARELVARIVERLAETWGEDGGWPKRLAWIPPGARPLHVEGELDVGVAHGAGGVLPVLAAAVALGLGGSTARELYAKTRDWILACRLDEDDSTFPGVIVSGRVPTSTRAGWCYGDPGMAAALHAAGRAVGDDELMAVAVRTGERSLARPVARWGVSELGLCHGAAGVARCFHRLYRATEHELFARAARAWFDVLLRADPSRVCEGVGVLTGAVGIGLTLIDALSGSCSGWDRPLALCTVLDEAPADSHEKKEVA